MRCYISRVENGHTVLDATRGTAESLDSEVRRRVKEIESETKPLCPSLRIHCLISRFYAALSHFRFTYSGRLPNSDSSVKSSKNETRGASLLLLRDCERTDRYNQKRRDGKLAFWRRALNSLMNSEDNHRPGRRTTKCYLATAR